MDEGDCASAYADVFLSAAMKNHASGVTGGESAKFCEGCDEPIPEARRIAMPGCRLCVDCQAATEG